MSKYRLSIGLLALLILTAEISHAQSLRLEEDRVFGKVESDSVEYLFGGPRKVVTDSRGRVYVVERSNVRVFNADGSYHQTVGRMGRGPGDFIELHDIAVDSTDHLHLLDFWMRRITVFNDRYELEDTYSVEGEFTNYTTLLLLPGNRYGLIGISAGGLETNNVLNVMDPETGEIEKSLLPAEQLLFHPDNPPGFNRRMASSPGYRAVRFGKGTVAILHQTFSGKLLLFDPQNEPEPFSAVGSMSPDAIRLLDSDSYEEHAEKELPGLALITGSLGRWVWQHRMGSLGLIGNSRYLLHFYYTVSDDNTRSVMLDMFDAGGNLLETIPVEQLEIEIFQENRLRFIPMHLDEQNRIYFTDYRSGAPVVRRMQLVTH